MSAYMGQELLLFIKSLWYGVVLLVTYDCMRILRMVFRHSNSMVGLEDLLFWAGSSLFLFSRFFRENAGILRAYLFVGVTAGILAWHFSLSPYFVAWTGGWMLKMKRKGLILVKWLKFWSARCRISLDTMISRGKPRGYPDRGEKHGEKEKRQKKSKSAERSE